MKETKTHIYFWGSEFSNFYRTEFIYKGLNFVTSEQAFMWEKAKFFGQDKIAVDILNSNNPAICKALGRSIPNFNFEECSKVCYEIMVAVNLINFTKNIVLYAHLLDTKNKTLVEGSPSDKICGVGLHYQDPAILDEKNWDGQNLLGKALMEVRDKIKN